MCNEPVILLVEDSDDDATLVMRAFRKGRVLNPIHLLRTGQDAIAYLSGLGEYSDLRRYPRPALVLLDLSLPEMSGFEVLRWIRQESNAHDLRVIVLSGSVNPDDARLAYELGADSFLIKPLELDKALDIGKCLHESRLNESQAFPTLLLHRDGWQPRELAA